MTETLFIRPMMTDDNVENTGIDTQFFVGDILVCPVLESESTVDCLIPKGDWCKTDFPYDCFSVDETKKFQLPVSMESIPSFYRSGKIYPVQKPEMTISETLKNPLEIFIVFGRQPGEEVLQAYGTLFVDDGESLTSENIKFSFYAERNRDEQVTGRDSPDLPADDLDGTGIPTLSRDNSSSLERTNYGDSTTELKISCGASFDKNFDISVFRNLNLQKIMILNSNSIPEIVTADGKVRKQKLRFEKIETLDVQINLFKNHCREDIVINWNSVQK